MQLVVNILKRNWFGSCLVKSKQLAFGSFNVLFSWHVQLF